MRQHILYIALLVILCSGLAFADSNAALQITAHSTVPATVYAGAASQLQLTILNSGSDTAGEVGIDYSTPSQPSSSRIYIGDIGAGTTATATVPFTVPQNVGSGFFVINLNVVYFGDAAHTIVKNTPTTIPVIVAQHQVLSVKTVSIAPSNIQPGDKVTAVLEISNTGGVMNNVVISTSDSSAFTLEGASQQAIGNIPSGGNITVPVVLGSSSSTATGKYTIPVLVTYQDSLQNAMNQSISIGPVTVTDSSAQFRISMVPVTSTEIGSEAKFDLTIENTGDSSASPMVDLTGNDEFTPIGTTRIFFDDIEPGKNQTKTMTIGIVTNSAAGYYELPLEITSNGKTYTQKIGITVTATPDVIVTTETTPAYATSGSQVKVLAQISNNGNSQIRSVYATVGPQKAFSTVGTTDKFIGTMNVDDFATFQFTINIPPSTAAGEYSVPIDINFKDKLNIERTLHKSAAIMVYSGQDAMRFNATSSGSGFSGANGRQNGSIFTIAGFGIGLVQIVIAIVVLVGGYFAYKKWWGKKK